MSEDIIVGQYIQLYCSYFHPCLFLPVLLDQLEINNMEFHILSMSRDHKYKLFQPSISWI